MGGGYSFDPKDIKIFSLKVRMERLIAAIRDCNALDMGDDVSIKLDLWEVVEKEIEDCAAILKALHQETK